MDERCKKETKIGNDLFQRGALVIYTSPEYPGRAPSEEMVATYLGAWFVGQHFRRHRIQLADGTQRYVSAAAIRERSAISAQYRETEGHE